jgi:hypothetical protein
MTHISDEQVRGLPLSEGRAELLEEIMSTPVIDRADATAPGPRRTPAVLVALIAAAAVIAAVFLPGYLLKDDGRPGFGSSPTACWDGAAGPTCTSPHGKAGLEWAFPRLAGHLDQCAPIDAVGRSLEDDLPMTFGTPSPGDGAAFRCTLTDLGVAGADAASPVIWVFAFGADNGRDLRAELASFDPQRLTLDGERAGTIAANDVGLIRPSGMFMAAYDDFPFAVVGYASDHDEALAYLAALGMRPPSQLSGPGATDPVLPDFPGAVLMAPSATPVGNPGETFGSPPPTATSTDASTDNQGVR